MFLREDKGKGRICVYSLEPNEDKVKNYKKYEISKVPNQDMIYTAKTNYEDCQHLASSSGEIELSKLNYNNKEFFFTSLGAEYHEFKKLGNELSDNFIKKAILDNYCNGAYDKSKVVVVTEKDKLKALKYLLLTKEYEKQKSGIYLMNDIISLPESLYQLRQLVDGNIENINVDEVENQLELFDYSKIPLFEINTRTLNNIEKYNLGINTLTPEMLENEQMILRKVREINKLK